MKNGSTIILVVLHLSQVVSECRLVEQVCVCVCVYECVLFIREGKESLVLPSSSERNSFF
jgi:hypothetical protein